jgi:hypothetical protein
MRIQDNAAYLPRVLQQSDVLLSLIGFLCSPFTVEGRIIVLYMRDTLEYEQKDS